MKKVFRFATLAFLALVCLPLFACGEPDEDDEKCASEGHQYVIFAEEEASCLTKGSRSYQCERCGYIYEEIYAEALGHKWGEYVATEGVDCQHPGTETATCERCNATDTRISTGYEHVMGDAVKNYVGEPTCTNDGYAEYIAKCKNCDYEETTYVVEPMLPHTLGKETVTKKSTCTEHGSKSAECQVCHKVEVTELPLAEHQYTWVLTKEASEKEKGLEELTCSVCGKVKEQKEVDYNPPVVEEHKHAYVTTVTQEGNCQTNRMIKKKCSECGDEITENQGKGNHVPGAENITMERETCCIGGIGMGITKCSVCGETIATRPITTPANGVHSFGADGICAWCGFDPNAMPLEPGGLE